MSENLRMVGKEIYIGIKEESLKTGIPINEIIRQRMQGCFMPTFNLTKEDIIKIFNEIKNED